MNKRQEDLLTYLINNQNYEPIEMIAKHFAVSVKTIRRDLSAIERLLSSSDNKVDTKRGSGVRLVSTPTGIEIIQQFLSNTKRFSQDRKERNLLQAFFILFSALDTIPLKALSSDFYISRSQLLLDIRTLEELFNPYCVKIITDRDGIRASGGEKNLTDLSVYLFSQFLDYGYPIENILYPIKIQKSALITGQLITLQDIKFLNHIQHSIENISSKKIWKQDSAIIFISLLVLIKRKTIFAVDEASTTEHTQRVTSEDDLPNRIRTEIEREYGVSLDDSNLGTITHVFLSTGLVHDPAFSHVTVALSNRKQWIHDFSEDFIDAFTTITDIDLRENAIFCERIHDHIEPMINRVLFNLGIADRFLETYGQEYHSTMNVCEVISWILSKKYDLPEIPRAEVLFLMLYIQTEIIEAESRLKVGFLCDDEKSIVNWQLSRLAKEFPNWELTQYQRLNAPTFFKDDLDFVIATQGNPLENSLPHVEISHKMSELDLKLIKSTVFTLTSDSSRELTKLQNIFRDLLDLGCSIVFSQEPFKQASEDQQMLSIEGVGNCVFHYLDKGEGNHTLYVQCPASSDEKYHFYFSMNNWDFLLFASKIVFLVDRTNPAELDGSIERIKSHLKEINV
jgi:transcriptional antiterminator